MFKSPCAVRFCIGKQCYSLQVLQYAHGIRNLFCLLRPRPRPTDGFPYPTGDIEDKQTARAKNQSYQEELKRQVCKIIYLDIERKLPFLQRQSRIQKLFKLRKKSIDIKSRILFLLYSKILKGYFSIKMACKNRTTVQKEGYQT